MYVVHIVHVWRTIEDTSWVFEPVDCTVQRQLLRRGHFASLSLLVFHNSQSTSPHEMRLNY